MSGLAEDLDGVELPEPQPLPPRVACDGLYLLRSDECDCLEDSNGLHYPLRLTANP